MYKNILVSISHGSNSYNLFKVGLELALKYRAQLTLCHIKNLQYIMPNYTDGNVYVPQDIIYFETNDGIEDTLNKYKDEALKTLSQFAELNNCSNYIYRYREEGSAKRHYIFAW